VKPFIRTKNSNNFTDLVTVNINLIFTLWHKSSVVHINLSTAVTN